MKPTRMHVASSVSTDGLGHGAGFGAGHATADLTAGLNSCSALQQEVLFALTEGSPDIVFVVGRDGIIKYINKAGAAQIQQAGANLAGSPLAAFFPPDGAGEQVGHLAHVVATGQAGYHESMWRFAHGDRWVGTWFAPLRDEHDNIVAVLGVARDLTVRKHTERALRESEERYRQLVELLPYGVFVHEGGRIVFANTAGVELLGARRREELIGMSYLDFVAAEFLKTAKERINEVLELGARTPFHESQFVRLDGTKVDVEEISIPFEFDGRPAVQVIARDITATKKLASALEQSRARFEKIFRSGPAAMWLATVGEGRFIDVNDVFLQMLGYEQDEVLGRTTKDVGMWSKIEEWKKLCGMVSEHGTVHGFEAQFVHKTGRIRHVILSVEEVRFPVGSCLLFAALDITDRIQLEEQLRESQKVEAIGLLARGV
ncbi:MAG: PAS domain S-box protein, partial [Verrucomicrobiia bacterium]